MLNKIIKLTLPFIVLLGSLLIAFGLSTIEGATVIKENTITYGTFTWTYKYLDFNLYLQNIQNALETKTWITGLQPNKPDLPSTPTAADILGWVKFIGSIIFQYVINWVIYAFNWILLAPLKLLLYPLNLILMIFGINGSNNTYINILTTIYNFNLPYIPYF